MLKRLLMAMQGTLRLLVQALDQTGPGLKVCFHHSVTDGVGVVVDLGQVTESSLGLSFSENREDASYAPCRTVVNMK